MSILIQIITSCNKDKFDSYFYALLHRILNYTDQSCHLCNRLSGLINSTSFPYLVFGKN